MNLSRILRLHAYSKKFLSSFLINWSFIWAKLFLNLQCTFWQGVTTRPLVPSFLLRSFVHTHYSYAICRHPLLSLLISIFHPFALRVDSTVCVPRNRFIARRLSPNAHALFPPTPRFSVSLDGTSLAESWNMLTFTGTRGPGNERLGENWGTKNEKGPDHKGSGRPDFTGRRVLGNYRTFKDRKGSVTHYLTLDTSIVKLSTLRARPPQCLIFARKK